MMRSWKRRKAEDRHEQYGLGGWPGPYLFLGLWFAFYSPTIFRPKKFCGARFFQRRTFSPQAGRRVRSGSQGWS